MVKTLNFKSKVGKNANIKIARRVRMIQMKDRGGQVMMINIMYFLMALAILVAAIPLMSTLLNMAQQSDGLNCAGYYYNGDANNTLSYNASLPSNTLACVGIRFYLPYIVLVVLIVGVAKILSSRTDTGGAF